MTNCRTLAWSSVGKKFVSGATGLILVLFLIAHLIGNLMLYVGPDEFNGYAYFLEHLGHGYLLYLAEAGLLFFFLFHIGSGVSVAMKKRAAREQAYYQVGDAGGKSRKSLSSRTMIVSGLVILAFVVIHVRMFKFGPAELVMRSDGHQMKDLYMLVVNSFSSPLISAFYAGAMVLMGLHLRHGIWSAFQSLGMNHPRYMPALYAGGVAFGILLAFGFLLFPVILFLFNGHFAARGGI